MQKHVNNDQVKSGKVCDKIYGDLSRKWDMLGFLGFGVSLMAVNWFYFTISLKKIVYFFHGGCLYICVTFYFAHPSPIIVFSCITCCFIANSLCPNLLTFWVKLFWIKPLLYKKKVVFSHVCASAGSNYRTPKNSLIQDMVQTWARREGEGGTNSKRF